MIVDLRDELRKARSLAESGDMAGVVQSIDRALADLADAPLLTMDEAAALLGVRSPAVLAVLLRRDDIALERRGETFVVPLSEVERIADSEWVQDVRAMDRLHDLSADFGDEPMTPEELEALEAGRPGRLPWEAARDRTSQSA